MGRASVKHRLAVQGEESEINPREVDVEMEEASLRDGRVETGAGDSHPSTTPIKGNKLGAKSETFKSGGWGSEQDCFTRERIDVPSGIGDVATAQGSRFAFSRMPISEDGEDGEFADDGESDGEGGSIPCVIPERSTL